MKRDSGPAFPTDSRNGMTLRDYFAGQALMGILACMRDHRDAETVRTRVAKAYEYADTVLAERERE